MYFVNSISHDKNGINSLSYGRTFPLIISFEITLNYNKVLTKKIYLI
jgi:hypothetical protein